MNWSLAVLLVVGTPLAASILLTPTFLRTPTAAAVAPAEPSTLSKFVRRSKVYWLATRLFVDIKLAQRKDKSLRASLGLSEDDEHEQLETMWDMVHERNAAMLCRNIIRLSGFWVKVGQYLSSRADVMPPQYLRILSSLQDAVPPKPFDDVLHTLKEELGHEEQCLFESIDAEPLSTASLAQVHRATLVGGRQVVIKAQHRGVASLMRQDMANLGSILSVVARFDKEADFGPVVREWTAEVLKELDFRTEATNMAEVRALLTARRIRAIVPASVDELVTQRVLVMDFCEGFVCHTWLEPQTSRPQTGLPLTRLSLALSRRSRTRRGSMQRASTASCCCNAYARRGRRNCTSLACSTRILIQGTSSCRLRAALRRKTLRCPYFSTSVSRRDSLLHRRWHSLGWSTRRRPATSMACCSRLTRWASS